MIIMAIVYVIDQCHQVLVKLLYSSLLRQVRGHQFGSPNAFLPYNDDSNINATYIDGISITYDSNPRKHF